MNELRHYGVLGMKWGVRKDGMPQGWQGRKGAEHKVTLKDTVARSNRSKRGPSAQEIQRNTRRQTAENRRKREAEKKRRSDMEKASRERSTLSDQELDRRIKRLEKERKLKSLTEQELHPGRQETRKAVSETGKKVGIGVGLLIGSIVVYTLATGQPPTGEQVLKKATGFDTPKGGSGSSSSGNGMPKPQKVYYG